MARKQRISINEQKHIIKLYEYGISTIKIGEMYGLSSSTIAYYLYKQGVKLRDNSINSRLFTVNHNYFEKIDSDDKAYWLGFMYADGYVASKSNQVGLTISKKDINHLEKFRSCLDCNYPIHTYRFYGYSKGNEYCRFIVTSRKLKDDLIKQGCIKNKTNVLSAPIIREDLIPDFIRGYIDGDGCIAFTHIKGYPDWRVKICGTIDILDFIKKYIEENDLAIIRRYYERKPGQIVKTLELTGNNRVKKFLELIYKDSTVFLERKYNKYIELVNYNSRAK